MTTTTKPPSPWNRSQTWLLPLLLLPLPPLLEWWLLYMWLCLWLWLLWL